MDIKTLGSCGGIVKIKGLLTLKFMCRFHDFDEEVMSAIDIKAISELKELYSYNTFDWGEVKVQSVIDWNNLTSRIISSYDINGPFFKEINGQIYKTIATLGESTEGIFSPVQLPISLTFSSDINTNSQINSVKKLLFDLFFVSNIGIPGLINFYSVKITIGDKEESLSLSSYYFDESLSFETRGLYPYTSCYSLKESKSWFDCLELEQKTESDKPIERAIFSLLHICVMDADIVDISMVTWIFHALEAIYGTKAGRGFNDMSSQIFFLLDVPDKKRNNLKKKLRELNDLRSSFVHGGYKVPHPLNEDFNEKVFELTNFGVVLIICSLQQLMKNNWSGLQIFEIYEGITCIDS